MYNICMEKVVICGLGAVGMTYAVKFKNNCNLKILADTSRIEQYKQSKPCFNGIEQEFEYVEPSENNFKADLIIISTKSYGLDEAIFNIKNFVRSGTFIISLLNGISSEEKIKKHYPEAVVPKSYFIGHSAIRNGNNVIQDGIGEIVTENIPELTLILDKCGIKYSCPADIEYSMWLKFTLNIFSNQVSAILNMTFGELKNNRKFLDFAKKLISEVQQIAAKKGVHNIENLEFDSLKALSKMCDEGKTSMLQDILNKRKTEVDIFAGEIIKLGKEFNILTPNNQVLYDLIKITEEKNEHCIHSCTGGK